MKIPIAILTSGNKWLFRDKIELISKLLTTKLNDSVVIASAKI
jgi:hypothetical protein